MNKQPKLKKPKDQKDLTELWDCSMNRSQQDSKTPMAQKANKPRSTKKRTPPSAEKPKLKRSLTIPSKEEEATNMEIEDEQEPTQPKDSQKSTKVKLTPELLELHRMLNKDWSDKLDQKLDPLQTSVNEIKSNLTAQETKIEQVMKIKEENIKLHN